MSTPPRPTLADVARHAGVSKMTASRVLRKLIHVSADKRERVFAAAEELGYRPNPLVQTLMSGLAGRRVAHESVIAWLTSHEAPGAGERFTPFYKLMRDGAAARAAESGFGMEEIWVAEPGMTEKRLGQILQTRAIRGGVVAPLRQSGSDLPIPWSDLALCAIGTSLSHPILHRAMANQYHLMASLMERIIARKFRRIGFMTYTESDQRSDHGPLIVFEHFTLLQPARSRIPPLFADSLTADALRKWVARHRPEVIISTHGGEIQRLRKAGLRVPEDVGFATTSWSPRWSECAGMAHPFGAVGAAAVDSVIAQLHRNERGVPAMPKTTLIDGRWRDGITLPCI